jgi:hypothetical protein
VTLLAQSFAGQHSFNAEQAEHGLKGASIGHAVGVMVVFTIYLRQRGSPESKPVGAPHDETGTSG